MICLQGLFNLKVFALRSPHCALRTSQFALRTSHFALRTSHFAPCTSHLAPCTLHFALCTLHFALCTLHFALRTSHFALCTSHLALLTSHFALCKELVARGNRSYCPGDPLNLPLHCLRRRGLPALLPASVFLPFRSCQDLCPSEQRPLQTRGLAEGREEAASQK